MADELTTRHDVASLEEIERIYRSRLAAFRRVGRAVLGDSETARDAVQDGFVRAVRDRASFRGEGSLESWIWACVMNAVRTAGRREWPLGQAAAEHGTAAHAEAEPGDDTIRVLIERLPERQRLALFLRYYADLDYAAIGASLGIAPGTVAASLHAAHNTLREELEEASG